MISHRCKKNVFYVFYYFYKNALFNDFFLNLTFWRIFYPAEILLNLLNSCIKRLSSDGFNMTSIKNSLMKSRKLQTLSCI